MVHTTLDAVVFKVLLLFHIE